MNQAFVPTPLRYRHRLEPRETGPGFAARLAAMNGRRMGEMFHHMGIRPYAVDNGDEDAVRIVAALGNASPERLIAFTPKTVVGKREYHVAGEVLRTLGLTRTFFRYCPHCVLEDLQQYDGPRHARPWLRLEWTVTHYRACHRHHAFMVSADPVRRRFQPFDFSETIEMLLPDLNPAAADAALATPSRFDEWIVARIEGVRDTANWLDGFPLYVAAEWCEALGISMLHPAKVATSRLTEAQWAAAAEEGFRISSTGEAAIWEALQRLTAAEKRTRGIVGPRDTYGYAFGLLQKTMDDEAFEPLRKVVRDYAMHAMPWKIGTDMLGITITENAVVTVTTAAQVAGADRKTIRKIFKRKGIAAGDIEAGLRDHRVTVAAGEIESVLKKLKGAITAPAAMKMLGIDRRQLDALVAAGALTDASGDQRETWSQARYAVEDIDAMMAKLLECAVEVEKPTDRQVPIIKARHMAGASAVEVLQLVFGGKLAWKGRLAGRTNFHAVLVDADEVTMLLRAVAPQFENLRFGDVPTVIPGLSDKSVRPLIEMKQLDEDEELSPNARRAIPVVTRPSAEEFHRNYVTAGELCQTHGLHHKQVKSILTGAGLGLAFDQDLVRTMIYDRAAVERAAARREGFWSYAK